jgi:hypothetical protein
VLNALFCERAKARFLLVDRYLCLKIVFDKNWCAFLPLVSPTNEHDDFFVNREDYGPTHTATHLVARTTGRLTEMRRNVPSVVPVEVSRVEITATTLSWG